MSPVAHQLIFLKTL